MSNTATLRKISLVAAGSALLTFGCFEAVQVSSSAIFNSNIGNAVFDNSIPSALFNGKNTSITGITDRINNSRKLHICFNPKICG